MQVGRGGEGEKRREASNRGSSHHNKGSRRDHSRPGLHESASVHACVRSRPERGFLEPTAIGERAYASGRHVRPACGPLPCVPDWIAACDASAPNDRAHVYAAACAASVGRHRFFRETVFWSAESLPYLCLLFTHPSVPFLLLTLPVVSCDTRLSIAKAPCVRSAANQLRWLIRHSFVLSSPPIPSQLHPFFSH